MASSAIETYLSFTVPRFSSNTPQPRNTCHCLDNLLHSFIYCDSSDIVQ